MRGILLLALLAPLALSAAMAQTANPPRFDAATIRPAKPGSPDQGIEYREFGHLEARNMSVLDMIAVAFSVDRASVVGGRPWLGSRLFDLSAVTNRNATSAAQTLMLQSLLAERFGLTYHRENQPLPVYVLTTAGPTSQLKQASADGDGAGGCQGDQAASLAAGYNVAVCKAISMAQLADLLPQMARAYVDHPVVDETGLKGAYDFSLGWVSRAQLRSPSDPDYDPTKSVSLSDGLAKLGLKLEPQQRPISAFIVDRVSDTLIAGGATPPMPPPPTKFEVAVIKPSAPGKDPNPNRFLPSGQIELNGNSLKDLITAAYDIPDDRLVAAQSWIDADHFDLVAKTTPEGMTDEGVRLMLQNLLKERFGLVAHTDTRAVDVYALTAPGGKSASKLKPAGPSEPSDCKRGGADGFAQAVCTNQSMAQLADELRSFAGGYLDHGAVDLTGIEGSYDFTLRWMGAGRVRQLTAPNPNQSTSGVAADPVTTITIFDAVDKQLGLKLSKTKHDMPVIVVDKVNRQPTQN